MKNYLDPYRFGRLQSVRYRVAIACFIAILLTQSSRPTPTNDKPNIIVIITDDQRFNTIAALSDDHLITPHLDSLVAAGTTFTHAYNMGAWNGAVCGASRAMLMTGQPLWLARQSDRDINNFSATNGLWVKHLSKAGYKSYMSGKWGLRTNVNAVFDVVSNEWPGPLQTPEGYNRPLSSTDTLWTPWNKSFGGFWKDGNHASELVANDAIRFLEMAATDNQPFFMYLSFHAPHDPRQSPKEFIEKHPFDKIKLPSNYLEQYPYKDLIGAGVDSRDEQLAPFPRTPHSVKTNIREYFAIISHLDTQVGKILRAVARSGKNENTIVFFVSDHGLAVGQHGLMGKQNMFDHSIRVPLIVSGQEIPKGEKRDQQVYFQDIMATTYDLAEIPKPPHIYYHNLLPLIRNKKHSSPYTEIYGAYMTLQRMVRTERYKLIVYPQANKQLLFDLKNDPDELQDLSDQKRFQPVLRDMQARLIRQQQLLNDTLNLSGVLQAFK